MWVRCWLCKFIIDWVLLIVSLASLYWFLYSFEWESFYAHSCFVCRFIRQLNLLCIRRFRIWLAFSSDKDNKFVSSPSNSQHADDSSDGDLSAKEVSEEHRHSHNVTECVRSLLSRWSNFVQKFHPTKINYSAVEVSDKEVWSELHISCIISIFI